jgi:hypothetical protein
VYIHIYIYINGVVRSSHWHYIMYIACNILARTFGCLFDIGHKIFIYDNDKLQILGFICSPDIPLLGLIIMRFNCKLLFSRLLASTGTCFRRSSQTRHTNIQTTAHLSRHLIHINRNVALFVFESDMQGLQWCPICYLRFKKDQWSASNVIHALYSYTNSGWYFLIV